MKKRRKRPEENHQQIDPQELSVSSNRARKLSLLILFFAVLMVYDGFSRLYTWQFLSSVKGESSLKIFLIVGFILIMGFLGYRCVQHLRLLIQKAPTLILSQEGLWLERYGLIPWDNIAAVELLNMSFGEDDVLHGLGIRFKDPDKVLIQRGLMGILLNSIRRSNSVYHLALTHLDGDCNHVVLYARNYILPGSIEQELL